MDSFLVAVTLYVREGKEAEFHAYERAALARLTGHHGEILARMRCSPRASGERAPYEFHLLRFPTEAAFSSFVASGVAYQEERDRAIATTTVVVGTSIPGTNVAWTSISGANVPGTSAVGGSLNPPTDP